MTYLMDIVLYLLCYKNVKFYSRYWYHYQPFKTHIGRSLTERERERERERESQ